MSTSSNISINQHQYQTNATATPATTNLLMVPPGLGPVGQINPGQAHTGQQTNWSDWTHTGTQLPCGQPLHTYPTRADDGCGAAWADTARGAAEWSTSGPSGPVGPPGSTYTELTDRFNRLTSPVRTGTYIHNYDASHGGYGIECNGDACHGGYGS